MSEPQLPRQSYVEPRRPSYTTANGEPRFVVRITLREEHDDELYDLQQALGRLLELGRPATPTEAIQYALGRALVGIA